MMLIFWDWLDTLVSPSLNINYCLKKLAAKYGKGEIDMNSSLDIFTRAQIEEFKQEIKNCGPGFIPVAWALVEKFHKLNMKQVIVSNSGKESIEKDLIIAPFKKFDLICTASHFKPKPDIEMFLFALNKFKIKNEDAIFIADNEIDEQSAINAKIKFFKVDGSINSYAQIAKFFNFL